MADILLHGVEMPTEQRIEALIFKNGFVAYYDVDGRYIGQAKAVPIPEGHGRLMDAERFRVILCRLKERQNDDVATHALNWAIECLDKLDTIIPAEGGADDGT